jgi:hypothetical protein
MPSHWAGTAHQVQWCWTVICFIIGLGMTDDCLPPQTMGDFISPMVGQPGWDPASDGLPLAGGERRMSDNQPNWEWLRSLLTNVKEGRRADNFCPWISPSLPFPNWRTQVCRSTSSLIIGCCQLSTVVHHQTYYFNRSSAITLKHISLGVFSHSCLYLILFLGGSNNWLCIIFLLD